ncbi:MAG: RagB/SusD family nutrient uptake outer membrane protein [Mediterranea sp.]|jgi:hypothetical protein|nr:RagB/SusD family nutrient uptake outer membrane protein [Mediterranea sp.]
MKKIKIFLYSSIVALIASSCTDMLEEQPRSSLTPDFFKTEQGIEAGLTAAYAGLRFQFGPEGAMVLTCVGTDETTKGGDGDVTSVNNYSPELVTNGHLSTPWNRDFTYINTCNGIIDNAGSDREKAALVAEAHFLRAIYYLNLVTTFGAVPLDLGSGSLSFNATPNTESTRNKTIEVYEAIAADLNIALKDLPVKPVSAPTGRATQATALHFLAKTYLAMACYYDYDYANELGSWESPQPNASKAAEYYLLALSTSKELLNGGETKYGVKLLNDFADVVKAGNEHSSEVIFAVEHSYNYTFDESGPGGNGGPESGLKENRSNYMMCAYYEGPDGNGSLLQRTREYGRGWRRFIPTQYLTDVVFEDKVNDTRYYKSFQSLWRVNKPGHEKFNEPAIYMPGYANFEAAPAEVQAIINDLKSKGADIRYTPQYTRNMFPSNLKFVDPVGDNTNDTSHRPFIVAKLSETILIAAEAAYKTGDTSAALAYINQLRTRAAEGHAYDFGGGNVITIGDNSTAIKELTYSGSIDIDFILNERSRELCCEQLRWFDLVRTNKLIERLQKGYNKFGDKVNTNNILDTDFADRAAANVKRYHHLRPIPQGQMDAMTNANKSSYQNPGY